MHTFAHSFTCSHLQIVCSQSGTPRNVQPPRALILVRVAPHWPAQHRHTSTPAYTSVFARTHIHMYPFPVHTGPGSTRTQGVCTRKKPTGTNLHPCGSKHTSLHTHMPVQLRTYTPGASGIQAVLLSSSLDEIRPWSFPSCPKI